MLQKNLGEYNEIRWVRVLPKLVSFTGTITNSDQIISRAARSTQERGSCTVRRL